MQIQQELTAEQYATFEILQQKKDEKPPKNSFIQQIPDSVPQEKSEPVADKPQAETETKKKKKKKKVKEINLILKLSGTLDDI